MIHKHSIQISTHLFGLEGTLVTRDVTKERPLPNCDVDRDKDTLNQMSDQGDGGTANMLHVKSGVVTSNTTLIYCSYILHLVRKFVSCDSILKKDCQHNF